MRWSMARILIIDGMVDAADGLSTLFKAMGHETWVAAASRAVVDDIRQFAPDIVFLSLEMTQPGGSELAEVIRSETGIAQPFLIALTDSRDPQVHATTQAIGIEAFIRRPVHPHTLIAIVTDVSSRVPRTPSASSPSHSDRPRTT